MNAFTEMVIDNLREMDGVFSLTSKEMSTCVRYAEKIGWQSAKPSVMAFVIVRIVKKELGNKDFYRNNPYKIGYNTLKKWVIVCCPLVRVRQVFFK